MIRRSAWSAHIGPMQQTTVIILTAAIVFAVACLVDVGLAFVLRKRVRASFDALRGLYEGQYAAIWQEAYDQGVADERTAAEYNTGTHEKVSANRVNPYGTEDTF